MTHTYKIDGMTCNGCAAKVKSQLLMHPDVLSVDIRLESNRAIISMQQHITVAELQRAIETDSNYRISEEHHHHEHAPANVAVSTNWWSTYKPIVLIGMFISAVSILTANVFFFQVA